MPALSNVDSLLSSHRSGLCRRKPGGGGPEGVAYRREEVEKAARGEEVGVNERVEFARWTAGRQRTTSIVKGFADAMLLLLVASLLRVFWPGNLAPSDDVQVVKCQDLPLSEV